jgi:tetratricopeptide (TPR) repeat protein
VIGELVSNVRNQRPFVSLATDSAPAAEQVFRDAQALDQQGDYEQAKRLYMKAKDLDALRFRASEEFNDIIHRTAEKYHGPVVPVKSYFEAASPQGIVGDHLMVDHLHPNVEGCFLMAEAFLGTLKEADVIGRHWEGDKTQPIENYKQNWGMTNLDLACADLNIRYLKGGWPFQPRPGPNRTLQSFRPQTEVETLALQVLTDDSTSIIIGHYDLARQYERQGDYLWAYQEYRALYHTSPWSTIFLNGAARNLLRLKRTDEVPPLLVRSLEIKETFFAQRWLGHLLVNQGRFTEAIPYLEKAREGHEDNEQVLMCLEKAYQYTGRPDEAFAIRQRLKTLPPRSEE